MPNKHYLKGRYLEYSIQSFLRGKGYFVIRHAGSHFPDLVAIKNNEVLLVECKTDGRLSLDEKAKLRELMDVTGGTPCLAYRGAGRSSWLKIGESIAHVDPGGKDTATVIPVVKAP